MSVKRHTGAALALLPLLVMLLAVRAPAQSAPPGWTVGHAAGGALTYTPPGLAPDQVYLIAVFPPVPLNGKTLEQQLQAVLARDPGPRGAAAGPPTAISRKERVVVAVRKFTVNGHPITFMYTEILGAGETAQLQQIVYTEGLYEKYQAETLAIGRVMVRALQRLPADDRTREDRPQPPARPVATPPGAGVKPSQIQGVYTEYVIQSGVGGFFTQVFKPLLALKDGTFCEYLDVAPADLDVAASRRRYPDRWGRWRFNASATSHRWEGSAQHLQAWDSRKGAWKTAEWIGPLAGGGPGQHLSGTYHHTGGSGNIVAGGGMAAVEQDSYTFLSDGHFRAGRDVGMENNIGTFSDTYSGKSAAAGTYTMANYALTLRFRDGSVRRCLYARVEDGMIFMQDDAYTKGDK